MAYIVPSQEAFDLLKLHAELDVDAPLFPIRKQRRLMEELEKAGLVARDPMRGETNWRPWRFTITASGKAWYNLTQQVPL